ncbi:VWA domain-containing protein, partial [candidate division KSB1 bacterium]|nr:VWA domain-containing protein [candidate division KSB1 bacterium]
RIGLVSYSDFGVLERNLDRDFNSMKDKISTYQANGYTNIGDAILKATTHLNAESPSRTKKTIVLLSDGQATKPGYGLPTNPTAINYAISQARNAANYNIRIYTVSLGNQTDINLMTQIATITGGRHHYAPTTGDLYDIFEEIAERVPSSLIG